MNQKTSTRLKNRGRIELKESVKPTVINDALIRLVHPPPSNLFIRDYLV